MAQPRDSRGRFASTGWPVAGVAAVALAASAGLGTGGGAAGVTATGTSVDASAAREAARRGLTSRNVVRIVRPVLRAGHLVVRARDAGLTVRPHRRLALRFRVRLSNDGARTVVVRGHDQILVTYDKGGGSKPQETRATDCSWTVKPGRRTDATLTFVTPQTEAPAVLRLRLKGVSVAVPLRVS